MLVNYFLALQNVYVVIFVIIKNNNISWQNLGN